MIRWKPILIRLSFLAVILGCIHFGTAPLLSLILRSTVQMITGSKLEIDNLDASPFQTRLSSGRVRLGHPKKEMENLFDYAQSEFQLDKASLLRKKFIVTKGTITGLEFGSGRIDSGKLPDNKVSSPTNDYFSSLGKKAATGLGNLLNQRFEENFELVQCAREVLDRWPAEYEQLLVRGKQLEKQIREIRDLAEEFKQNPLNSLRDFPKIEKSVRDVVYIRKEIDSVRTHLTDYRTQILQDRDNIMAAKERDLARIKEIKSDKRLNGRSLSQLLVGDTQGKRVDQAIGWIKWMRKTFPNPKDSIRASRSRGETIRFAGQVDQPDLLVRIVELNGHGTMDQKPYTFTGTLAGLTTQPEVYGKPAYLQLDATGNVNFTIKGMIDRSQKVDHDRLILNVPDLKIAAQDLKLDDDVRLQMDRSQVQIDARIDLVGDDLTGQIKATQRDFNLQLNSDWNNDFANDMKQMLNEDLKSIREFEIVAKLSGTVAKPKWHLHSDLGPQISVAVQNTLVRGLEKKKTELLVKLNSKTDETMLKLAKLVEQQEAKIVAFLGEQSKELFQLETRVSSLLRGSGLRFR